MSSTTSSATPRTTTGRSYLVGRDGEGHWVALGEGGRAGGLFRSREAAIRFACIETGRRPDEIAVATGPLRVVLS